MSDRLLVILNPASSGGKGAVEGRQILLHAERLGIEMEIRETGARGDERKLASDAAGEGWPVIAAAGGDGTLHGVANGILDHPDCHTALGVIPIGTGNDYARSIGVPVHNVRRAMDALAAGEVRKLDVGFALNEHFVNAMGFGFGPAVVQNMEKRTSRNGFLPYLNSIVSTFWSFDPPYLEAVSPDLAVADRVMMVEVAIGKTVGGGMMITPDADPADGLADVFVIKKIGTFRFLRYLPRVMRGRHTHLPMVSITRADRLEVRTAGEPPVVHMDGELRVADTPVVDVQILGERLRVICGV